MKKLQELSRKDYTIVSPEDDDERKEVGPLFSMFYKHDDDIDDDVKIDDDVSDDNDDLDFSTPSICLLDFSMMPENVSVSGSQMYLPPGSYPAHVTVAKFSVSLDPNHPEMKDVFDDKYKQDNEIHFHERDKMSDEEKEADAFQMLESFREEHHTHFTKFTCDRELTRLCLLEESKTPNAHYFDALISWRGVGRQNLEKLLMSFIVSKNCHYSHGQVSRVLTAEHITSRFFGTEKLATNVLLGDCDTAEAKAARFNGVRAWMAEDDSRIFKGTFSLRLIFF